MTTDPITTALRDVGRRMLMARPWDAAPDWSQWEISGNYPQGRGTFTDCLAVVLPRAYGGADENAPAVFSFVGPLTLTGSGLIPASWITRATPLLLVLRDEPSRAYWEDEQSWLTR